MAVCGSCSAAVSAIDTCSVSVTGIRTSLASVQSVQAVPPQAPLPPQAVSLHLAALLPPVAACLSR